MVHRGVPLKVAPTGMRLRSHRGTILFSLGGLSAGERIGDVPLVRALARSGSESSLASRWPSPVRSERRAVAVDAVDAVDAGALEALGAAR